MNTPLSSRLCEWHRHPGRFIGSTQEHLLWNRSTRQIWHCRVYGTFSPHWAGVMRPDMSIRFAAENLASVEEPIYFILTPLLSQLGLIALVAHRLISHPLGVKLTGVKITTATKSWLMLFLCSACMVLSPERGMSPLLEITFDSASRQNNWHDQCCQVVLEVLAVWRAIHELS